MTTRKDIEQVLWNACDSFRGKIDSSRYKDYILSMLTGHEPGTLRDGHAVHI